WLAMAGEAGGAPPTMAAAGNGSSAGNTRARSNSGARHGMGQGSAGLCAACQSLSVYARVLQTSGAIAQLLRAMPPGAARAAVHGFVFLQPVTDDADAAMLTGRRQRVDRAFEAVERVGRAVHLYLKGLVVVVAAGFASRHGRLACRRNW